MSAPSEAWLEVFRWALIFVGAGVAWAAYELFYWRKWWPADEAIGMEYLRNTDSELSSAIRDMAWHSAWGKWYAAQTLALSKPADEESLMRVAAQLVGDAVTNGELIVRGRKPGELDYVPVDQTHWRSTALHMIPGNATRWQMILIPRGGAEISPDGAVKGFDQASTDRTNKLGNYDSLIVNSREFEKLWPRKDEATDRERREFLKKAKKVGSDEAEIKRLT